MTHGGNPKAIWVTAAKHDVPALLQQAGLWILGRMDPNTGFGGQAPALRPKPSAYGRRHGSCRFLVSGLARCADGSERYNCEAFSPNLYDSETVNLGTSFHPKPPVQETRSITNASPTGSVLDRCPDTSGFPCERLKHDNTGAKEYTEDYFRSRGGLSAGFQAFREERSEKNESKAAIPQTLYSHFLGLKRCIKGELRALLPLGPLVANPTSN